MIETTIGVIGGGVVGRATARSYIEHVREVRVYDIDPKRATHSLDDTLASDIIFVCLPTPQKADGLSADVTFIGQFFAEAPKDRRYVLRSTVPIGTTQRLRDKHQLFSIAHSPEFLTARCSLSDAQLPSRNVIGVPCYGSKTCSDMLIELYRARFPGVPLYVMSSDESEAVKLFQNGFFAVKVAYWNECRVLADRMGMDWGDVMQAIVADGRISPSHTNVPGPDGMRGYGGTCLPKDIANLITALGDDARVTAAAYFRNLEDRKR
jgi:UDPglucose 6-dehydrogenase